MFTNDLTIAWKMAEGLEAGIIGINDPVPATPQCPFGGMKESGLGRELGHEGLEAYLETKYVSHQAAGLIGSRMSTCQIICEPERRRPKRSEAPPRGRAGLVAVPRCRPPRLRASQPESETVDVLIRGEPESAMSAVGTRLC